MLRQITLTGNLTRVIHLYEFFTSRRYEHTKVILFSEKPSPSQINPRALVVLHLECKRAPALLADRHREDNLRVQVPG